MDFFVSFKNHKEEENKWKIFYSGFVDCYDKNFEELRGINYDSRKKIFQGVFDIDTDAYEVLMIFHEKSGERHFVRILHGSKIAFLDEIYGSKEVKVTQFNISILANDFPKNMNLDQYPVRQIYIKQMKWNE
ncbi:hypothetical protein M9Y10_002534 [Tritrichomonas musculus]|uniref:Uncharacterized protein n=1 Tax=Tritrichomonas musculus TaxID=1915356 RepID=A0ABR2LB26_9EUKA